MVFDLTPSTMFFEYFFKSSLSELSNEYLTFCLIADILRKKSNELNKIFLKNII